MKRILYCTLVLLTCIFLSSCKNESSPIGYDLLDNLDVTPDITGNQAIQIFSAYLKKPSESSWTATLYAREYHVRVEGETFRREQRLIYYVTGPATKVHIMGSWPPEIDTNLSAEIDAHTGQIIYVGMKHFIPF